MIFGDVIGGAAPNNDNFEKIGIRGCPSILRLMINGVVFGVLVSFNRGQFPPVAVAHLQKRVVR